MNTKIKLQIEALCLLTPALESCGFVILRHEGLHLMPCTNVAQNPAEHFDISVQDQMVASSQGRILYVYHSHPAPGSFSEADIESADESCIPQKLFNMAESTWYEYIPEGHRLPLEGRAWCFGESDCYSLIRDYFRQSFGIAMSDFDRDEDTPDLGKQVIDGFAGQGFVKKPGNNILQKNDVLIMRTNGSPQHMVIFQGNSRVLHHPRDALSRIDTYSSPWQHRLQCIVRHKSM